jgi:methyl-accepting chemotaxis protein
MVHALSAMVADVRSNAALVAQAGQSMVKDHQALSERTEMQASNLAQTVVSVEQLTAAVEHNAEVSKAAHSRADGVRRCRSGRPSHAACGAVGGADRAQCRAHAGNHWRD